MWRRCVARFYLDVDSNVSTILCHYGDSFTLISLLVQVTLATGWCLWRSWRRPFLTLRRPRTGRAGGASCTRGRVPPGGLSRPGDAVPRVAGCDCGRDATCLLFLRLAAFVVLVLVEGVGGHRRLRRWGRAGSGASPFERGERACVGGCGLPGRGRGRCFLLLGF